MNRSYNLEYCSAIMRLSINAEGLFFLIDSDYFLLLLLDNWARTSGLKSMAFRQNRERFSFSFHFLKKNVIPHFYFVLLFFDCFFPRFLFCLLFCLVLFYVCFFL